MKKKVSKRGGYRPGAGAKKTGINVFRVTFAIHKDDMPLIKEMVYTKIKELKAARAGLPLPKDFIKTTKVAVMDSKGFIKKIAETARKAPVSDYLKTRRNKKLGIK